MPIMPPDPQLLGTVHTTCSSDVGLWYYDRKIGAVNLKPGDLVLVKADAFKGKRKIKDR